MKLSSVREGDRIRIFIRGEADGSRCECLERFWERHVDQEATSLHVQMDVVDSMDARAVSTMVNLIRRSLASGARVVLDAPPQILTHTLYKSGMLQPGMQVNVINQRYEEPYAG